ncbi:Beta-glucosidase 13 [Platanthera guangdongensis]|uniref:Beta-glucosidase 13 n=1 Tax=Platanthera guangdongensis TaxID=2320717 RepID=A0ABR2M209_9ASPA
MALSLGCRRGMVTTVPPMPPNLKISAYKKSSAGRRRISTTFVRCSSETGRSNVHAGLPPDFKFGVASSSYQVEGATKEGGRGLSNWDAFCQQYPEKIADGSNGDPGAGSYWLYKDDVKHLVELGVDVYRFSISWSRILPNGRGKPNKEGIQYYSNLIQELLDHGIQPFVTLFHWDVPQKLEDEYGGFLGRQIVDDFRHFVDICFSEFGDKVKHWITMNEPLTFTASGYALGIYPPGHCTPNLTYEGQNYECPVGDSLTEPYIVGHNILLAHAEAVQLYKDTYKAKQGGKVGITLVTNWFEPYDSSPLNVEAQQRALESNLGWFLDPLKFGDYPFSMRSLARDRLPKFTAEESEKLKGSYDFIGLNYYTARYARNIGFDINYEPKIYQDDARFDSLVDKNGIPIGYAQENSWVNVYPNGLKELLLYVKNRYDNPEIYITENGVMQLNNNTNNNTNNNPPATNSTEISNKIAEAKELNDIYRAQYLASHIQELVEAIRSGSKVRGYFVWSLLDSFEWNFGYTSKFGFYYINSNKNSTNKEKPAADLTRIPKHSANWFKWFIAVANSPVVTLTNDQPPASTKGQDVA